VASGMAFWFRLVFVRTKRNYRDSSRFIISSAGSCFVVEQQAMHLSRARHFFFFFFFFFFLKKLVYFFSSKDLFNSFERKISSPGTIRPTGPSNKKGKKSFGSSLTAFHDQAI
jgi:penicillin-binding protein-related factor A (putative recombinase)